VFLSDDQEEDLLSGVRVSQFVMVAFCPVYHKIYIQNSLGKPIQLPANLDLL